MTDEELQKALKRLKVETGSLSCLGCGHEHNCSVAGCAIIREAELRVQLVASLKKITVPKTCPRTNKRLAALRRGPRPGETNAAAASTGSE